MGNANEAAVEEYAKQYIGHPQGKFVLKGILWVESKYGKYKIGDGSYGIAQIEVQTARHVADTYGFELPRTYKAVKDMLISDDRMNVKIAAAYLGLLERRFGSLTQAVIVYNTGPTRARSMLREDGRLPITYLNQVMTVAQVSEKEFENAHAPLTPMASLKTYLANLLNDIRDWIVEPAIFGLGIKRQE